MMRLKETIDDILVDDGIFHYIHVQDNTLTFLNDGKDKDLDIEYYLNHSGDKKISPMFQKLKDNDVNYMTRLAKIIVNKFGDNWKKVYDAYFNSEYNPIENYSMEEVETPDLTTTETPDLTTTTTDKQDTNITTSQSSNDYVSGYNSDEPVPTDEGTTTQSVSADADDNVRTIESAESGSKTTTQTGERTLTRKGNIGVTTSQQMLNSELELRTFDFYTRIMNDVDSVLCCRLY